MTEHEPPLLQQAMDLIEGDRAQLAHEIHDSLLPLIFAASATIDSLRRGPRDDATADPATESARAEQQEKLKMAAEMLEEALATGRRLLSQTYPPELTGTLWSHAVRDTIQRLTDARVAVTWDLATEIDDVSPAVALAAYRVVVEAVRNAIAHGGAANINICGKQIDQHLRITIIDNGKGFDPSSVSTDRFGIRSMKGRAKLVGGSLDLTSQAGQGTTVTLMLPAAPASDD